MKIKTNIRKYFLYLIKITLLAVVCICALHYYIIQSTKSKLFELKTEVPFCYTAIVLGAHVNKDSTPSFYLQDRLDAAIDLYNSKKIKRILVSGDHGQKEYDEVNTMKNYLLLKKIPPEDIFCDHAGFDTYSSIVRAKKIFEVDSCVLISQKFHLARTLFIANKLNLHAVAYAAPSKYLLHTSKNSFRESLANIKAFAEVYTHASPKYLGDRIPITGDSKWSYD